MNMTIGSLLILVVPALVLSKIGWRNHRTACWISWAPLWCVPLVFALLCGLYLSRSARTSIAYTSPVPTATLAVPHASTDVKIEVTSTSGSRSSATVLDFRGAPATTGPQPAETSAGQNPDTPHSEERPERTTYECFTGLESAGKMEDQPPNWVSERAVDDVVNDRRRFVLTSEYYPTIHEAEAQLRQQLCREAGVYFSWNYPQASSWRAPELDAAGLGTVLRRCTERRTLAVGEFREPMYRTHWLVEQTPELRPALFPAWRATQVQARVRRLGLACGSLTLLLAGLSLFLNRKPAAVHSAPPPGAAQA